MTEYISQKASRLFFSFASLLIFSAGVSAQSMFEKINDFDGDGKADFAITRDEPPYTVWYLWQSTGGYKQLAWGTNFDNIVAGDYDGDGRTDFAVARLVNPFPVTLDYYVLSSQTGSMMMKTVTSTAGPQWFQFQQDFDGDGKTDPGIVQGETQRIAYLRSTTNAIETRLFTGQGAVRIGDIDGDANCEIVGVSGTNLVTITNPANGNTRSLHWGISEDRFVPADFDGDGIGDLTIFRPSTGDWWWIRSSDNVVNAFHWGATGDIPVPADYDGDNRTDHAVYRRASPNSIYYVNGSQTGFQAFVWGISSDLPVVY